LILRPNAHWASDMVNQLLHSPPSRKTLLLLALFPPAALLTAVAVLWSPFYTVLLFAGLLLLLVTFFRPVYGVILFLFAIPLESVFASILGGYALKLVGAAVVLIWLLRSVFYERSRPGATGRFWAATLFVGWALASGLWADRLDSYFTTLTTLFSLLALYLLLVNIVQDGRLLERLLLTLVLSATLSACLALWQYRSGTELIMGRATGGSLDPNELAAVLVAGLLNALALAARARHWTAKCLLFAAAAVMVWALFASGSRSGILALGVAALAIAIFWPGAARFLLPGLVLCLFVVGWFLLDSPVLERFQELALFGGSQHIERLDLWRLAIRAIQEYPVLGLGLSNFRYSSTQLQFDTPEINQTFYENAVVHNAFLEVWAELGSVGIGLFLFLVLSTLYRLWGKMRLLQREHPGGKGVYLPLAVLTGLLLYVFMANTLSIEYSKMFWLLIILGDRASLLDYRDD